MSNRVHPGTLTLWLGTTRAALALGGDREASRRDDGSVPKWVVRGLQTGFVVASGAAFFLTGMTAVFLATGFVSVTPDCVMGHVAPPPARSTSTSATTVSSRLGTCRGWLSLALLEPLSDCCSH